MEPHRLGYRSEQTVTRIKATGSKEHAKCTSGSHVLTCFKPSPRCQDLVLKSRQNEVLVLRLVLGPNKLKSIAKMTSKITWISVLN